MIFLSRVSIWARFLSLSFARASTSVDVHSKPIIIDTDIFSDVDDVGALAIANLLDNCGLADLQAVMINTNSKYGATAASTINTYFHNPSIPIAALRPLTDETFLDTWTWTSSEFTSKLSHNFPHSLDCGAFTTPEPLDVYLSLLSNAEPNSLTIISLGHLTNLYNLLRHDSPLSTRDLLERKVKEIVIMGGEYPRGKEFNFSLNLTVTGPHPHSDDYDYDYDDDDDDGKEEGPVSTENVAAYVLTHLPSSVPVTFLGLELGAKVKSGGELRKLAPWNSPVRAAYEWYVGRCGTERESWDPLTVVYAILGLEGTGTDGDLFEFANEGGYNSIDAADGSNAWVDDDRVTNQHWVKLAGGVNEEEVGNILTRLFAWNPDSADCAWRVNNSRFVLQQAS